MGYYTCYSLEVEKYNAKTDLRTTLDRETFEQIVEAFRELEVIGYALTDQLDCYDSVKWYDHDEQMLQVSKQFPDVLFCLHGEGDESSDLWDAYYLNGKTQHCAAEIVYPEFDPAALR